jgi:hypothetical protein
MLLPGVSLLLGLLSSACAADIPKVLDCSRDGNGEVPKECEAPIAPVAAVIAGSSYIAKLECKDCPYQDKNDELVNGDHVLVCLIPKSKLPSAESDANHDTIASQCYPHPR